MNVYCMKSDSVREAACVTVLSCMGERVKEVIKNLQPCISLETYKASLHLCRQYLHTKYFFHFQI